MLILLVVTCSLVLGVIITQSMKMNTRRR